MIINSISFCLCKYTRESNFEILYHQIHFPKTSESVVKNCDVFSLLSFVYVLLSIRNTCISNLSVKTTDIRSGSVAGYAWLSPLLWAVSRTSKLSLSQEQIEKSILLLLWKSLRLTKRHPCCLRFYKQRCEFHDYSQWRIQNFPEWGSYLLFGHMFAENCMKMKEIWPRTCY